MAHHEDSLNCDCLTKFDRKIGDCQFKSCPNPDGTGGLKGGGEIVASVDDIYMHRVCWNAYDRAWKKLHPMANQEIVDSGIARQERMMGA